MFHSRRLTIGLLVLCLFALAFSVSSAQDATPESTPSDTDTTNKIAFSSLRDGNQTEAIYVMNADGSNPQAVSNLDHHAGLDYHADWSPDGTQIAYATNWDVESKTTYSDMEIYAANADGSNPHNLTQYLAYDTDPAWSPDGTQIAFASDRSGGLNIYVMNADGSDPHQLTQSPGGDHAPAWSPDGTQIIFVSNRDSQMGHFDLYVMNADGSDLRNLTNSPDVDDDDPAWSPDGTQIAFASNRADKVYEIYVMDADGSNAHKIIDDGNYNGLPAWSPDGSQIAFVSDHTSGGNSQIYVMNADGSDAHVISQSEPGQLIIDSDPAWRPEPKG